MNDNIWALAWLAICLGISVCLILLGVAAVTH